MGRKGNHGVGFVFRNNTEAITVLAMIIGPAINNTFRQVGAAVGVALVVTVQSQTEGIEGFRNGWKVAIGFALAAAAVSIFQPNKANQLA